MVTRVFDVEKAMKLQQFLSRKVLDELNSAPCLDFNSVHYIAAFDSSYVEDKQCAVVVIYDVVKSEVVERAYTAVKVNVPYIPGLLAFREVPGYVRVYKKISVEPDVLLVDGHGLSHPRALGIATHLGLVLSKPSIGVAKKHLYGKILEKEGRRLIYAHGRIVGEVIEHRNTQLYVSIGYRVKLEDAVNLVKKLLSKDKKLPTPLQVADEYSKIIKTKHCK